MALFTTVTTPDPFQHQLEGAAYAIQALRAGRGYYLAHKVGTGKTRTAIGVIRNLPAKRVLILAPVIALGVWEQEISRWWPGCGVGFGELGTPPMPVRLYGSDSESFEYVKLSYDKLTGTHGAARLKALLKWGPDLVILDEAQYVKSPTAQRTRAAHKVCRGRPVLLLSGTPAHTPLDWWSQYRIIAPADPLWAASFSAYREKVAVLTGPDRNWVSGFKKDAVQDVIANHILPHTHSARSMLTHEPRVQALTFDLSPAERRVYDQLEKDMIADLENNRVVDASNSVLAQTLRMQQVCSGWVGGEDPARPGERTYDDLGFSRQDALEEVLAQRPDEKVVIAYRFSYSAAKITVLLDKLKRPYFLINGGVPALARDGIVAAFQDVPNSHVLLLQYQAGGVGITLTAARTLVLYEPTWSSIEHEQMIGRLWRTGQLQHVMVHPLLAENTLEPDIYGGLEKKRTLTDISVRVLAGVQARAGRVL